MVLRRGSEALALVEHSLLRGDEFEIEALDVQPHAGGALSTRGSSNSDVLENNRAQYPEAGAGRLWALPDAVFERKMADDVYRVMPDGQEIRFCSYLDPSAPASRTMLPSPLIRIREGQQAQIRLESRKQNRRPNGRYGAISGSERSAQCVCTESVESHTYQWQPRSAGTWFYQSHANTPRQFEMGLYGVIAVDAEPDATGRPRAYHDGPAYDIERFWVFDDVDPDWHSSDLDGVAQADDKRLQAFNPKYFLINGVPNTEALHHADVAIEAKLGDKILLRLMNASFSLVKVSMEHLKSHIISVDGNVLGSAERPWTRWISVGRDQPVHLATASRHDLLIDLDPALSGVSSGCEYRVSFEFQDGARRQIRNSDAVHPAHAGRAVTTIRVL